VPNRFVAGHDVPVAWQPAGAASTTLDVKEHSVDLSVLLHDVTNNRHGGERARIAGPLDAQGTVQASLDLDQVPWNTPIPNVQPGVLGVIGFGVSATAAIQVPSIVEKFHSASAIEKEVNWSFDIKMSSIAGVVLYPAF